MEQRLLDDPVLDLQQYHPAFSRLARLADQTTLDLRLLAQNGSGNRRSRDLASYDVTHTLKFI